MASIRALRRFSKILRWPRKAARRRKKLRFLNRFGAISIHRCWARFMSRRSRMAAARLALRLGDRHRGGRRLDREGAGGRHEGAIDLYLPCDRSHSALWSLLGPD